MPTATPPSISIITVTLNCASSLGALLDSLLAQTDQDFEWVVVDALSTDGTVAMARRFPEARLRLLCEADFGIYDALNKGVRLARGDYYLVLGADDLLDPAAIAQYRAALLAHDLPDIVAADVRSGSRVRPALQGKRWLYGGNAFLASHAVGTLIRRSLHAQCGFYSRRYVNVADMHFILSAIDRANARVIAGRFVAGEFSEGGISSTDHICSLSEAFRVQMEFGENPLTQFCLYFARLWRETFIRRRHARTPRPGK